MNSELIQGIASETVLDEAYTWLCERRKNSSPNDDVWDLRRKWAEIKSRLQQTLFAGNYEFSPLAEFRLSDNRSKDLKGIRKSFRSGKGETRQVWSAQDALVLKAMAIVLGKYLDPLLSERCFHLKGRGGAKAAVRETLAQLAPEVFVMKSDVQGYYANIDHTVLFDLVRQYIPDENVQQLIWQYMRRTICYGGIYWEEKRGISLGCPLSPLMAALYLKPLNDQIGKTGLFYARFIDDWVIIAPTRWKLRKTIRAVNDTLNRVQVKKHPDKTFIGRGERGFNFLGYFLTPTGLEVSPETVKRFIERIIRLYEQRADIVRPGLYVRH